MTRIRMIETRPRIDRRLGIPSRLMFAVIGVMFVLGHASSEAAQKHRKYSQPNFHTGQGGLIDHPVSRHRGGKLLKKEFEPIPTWLEFVIPMPAIRSLVYHHRWIYRR
ncbi:MAG: hypothetical protein OSA40_06455 [Phycisphaerales bacterium]|jgi:hypothetical protein|nr:hypothetical protein [Phycisphaerales bacterium]